MPSRSSTAIAPMPRSAHTSTNSSGKDAPARKLNADRACNSVYINRTCPEKTIRAAARRNTKDKARAHLRAEKAWQFSVGRRPKNELPHPIPPGPTPPATSLLKCARALKRRRLHRASPEKISAREIHCAIPPAPEAPDEKTESR